MSKDNMNIATALITGGTKGIGYGIAEVLLAQGFRVAITGRDGESTTESAKKLSENATSGEAIGIKADVRKMADMEAAVKETV
ncbi:MAG: SDR family NAD(P)-dependent oxidoreductase, partial [Cryomorphaceae bacterium]